MKKQRVVIGIMGLDQHEVGALGIVRTLRDAGMEVVYAGKFNTPETMVSTALQEAVDLVGLSCHSWEYTYYVPELLDLLKQHNLPIPVVVGGSVITPEDEKKMEEMGVAAAFGPSSQVAEMVERIQAIIQESAHG